MSASKVKRIRSLCTLCQQQTYARKKALFFLHGRRTSSKVQRHEKDQKHTKPADMKSSPQVKMFPQEIDIDWGLVPKLQSGETKHRKHDGIMSLKTVHLPKVLEEAANVVVDNYSSGHKPLLTKAAALQTFLSTRVEPKEGQEYTKKLKKIYTRLIDIELAKAREKGTPLEDEDLEKLYVETGKRALSEAMKSGFTWKPLVCNADLVLTYLVSRLSQNYSVMLQILHEIKTRDSSFVPGAIYNFGSGIGSVVWAANSVWHNKIFEYYCVDQSGHMNTMARLLLQGGSENNKMVIPGVYFRQFRTSDTVTYKMVVCAYTLLELDGKKKRLDLVTSLWHKTEDYLVLVEIGNAAGYKLIMEARDHILNLKDKPQKRKSKEDLEGHIFAPCPHDSVCPKLEYWKNYCHFRSKYMPLHLGVGPRREIAQYEKYSYVVLKKGPRQEDQSWPRITGDKVPRHKHVYCHLCCPDGSLGHYVVTKNKYSPHLYKCTKKSNLGDRLPVVWPKDFKQLAEGSHSVTAVDYIGDSLTDTEQRLTDVEENLTESEDFLNEDVESLTDVEENLTESEDFLNEDVESLTDVEENLTESEDFLSEDVESLTDVEENYTESEESLYEDIESFTNADEKLMEFEESLHEDEESLPDVEENLTESGKSGKLN